MLRSLNVCVVDAHDEQAVHGLGAAHVEARLQRLALERLEGARLACRQADAAGHERDGAEGGEPPAACMGAGAATRPIA